MDPRCYFGGEEHKRTLEITAVYGGPRGCVDAEEKIWSRIDGLLMLGFGGEEHRRMLGRKALYGDPRRCEEAERRMWPNRNGL
jgi:hypothetical protein